MLRYIPTGCQNIDELLGGGVPTNKVCLIYGEAEIGKTTFVMQCAVNCARQGYKTLYMDCDNDFSVLRLKQITSKDFQKIAESIILIKPKDFNEQSLFVDHLLDYINQRTRLLIIDTATSLYLNQLSEHPNKRFELSRTLNRLMAHLAQITKTEGLAVLVTSQIRSVFDDPFVNIEPVANRVLKFWADIIIGLKHAEDPQILRAVLEKGSQKINVQNYLRMDETGLHDY